MLGFFSWLDFLSEPKLVILLFRYNGYADDFFGIWGNVTENVKKWFFSARHGWREATTNISKDISFFFSFFFLLKAIQALSILEADVTTLSCDILNV